MHISLQRFWDCLGASHDVGDIMNSWFHFTLQFQVFAKIIVHPQVSLCPPRGLLGAGVGVGMLRCKGFLGFLVSWFLGFSVSWCLGFLASWIRGFLISSFIGFLVSKFLGFLASWFQSFLVSKFLGLKVSMISSYQILISCFFERYWSHTKDFQDSIRRIVGIFGVRLFQIVQNAQFPKFCDL